MQIDSYSRIKLSFHLQFYCYSSFMWLEIPNNKYKCHPYSTPKSTPNPQSLSVAPSL